MTAEKRKEVAEAIKQILSGKAIKLHQDIADEATFDDLGIDSLDKIEIIMEMEERFMVRIPDEHESKIYSVISAVDYIEQRLDDKNFVPGE